MIFYKSKYGNAQRYARLLGQMTGLDVRDLSERFQGSVQDPVFVLSAYAGGLYGARQARSILARSAGQPLFVICGLSDPKDASTMPAARNMLKASGLGQADSPLFFVRGGIDYNRLSCPHRIMMWMLYQKAKHDPQFQDNGFLETYGKKADFFDPAYLAPVVSCLQKSKSVVE